MTEEQFEPHWPYTPAERERLTVCCPFCGMTGIAEDPIEDGPYPRYYLPHRWDAVMFPRGMTVHCETCRKSGLIDPVYATNRILEVAKNRFTDRILITSVEKPQAKPKETPVTDYPSNDIQTQDVPVTEPTVKSRLKEQAKTVGGAVVLGAQLAVADEAGEILLDIAKDLATEWPAMQMLLSHSDGRELAKVMVALSIHSMATHSSLVPKSEVVARVAELQITTASLKLIGPRLKNMREHFGRLSDVGERLGYNQPPQARVEDVEESELEEQNAVHPIAKAAT